MSRRDDTISARISELLLDDSRTEPARVIAAEFGLSIAQAEDEVGDQMLREAGAKRMAEEDRVPPGVTEITLGSKFIGKRRRDR